MPPCSFFPPLTIPTYLYGNWHIGVPFWCWAMCSFHLHHLKSRNELAAICWLSFSSPVPCSSSCSFCCQSLPLQSISVFFFLLSNSDLKGFMSHKLVTAFSSFSSLGLLHLFHFTYVLPCLFSHMSLSYPSCLCRWGLHNVMELINHLPLCCFERLRLFFTQ